MEWDIFPHETKLATRVLHRCMCVCMSLGLRVIKREGRKVREGNLIALEAQTVAPTTSNSRQNGSSCYH